MNELNQVSNVQEDINSPSNIENQDLTPKEPQQLPQPPEFPLLKYIIISSIILSIIFIIGVIFFVKTKYISVGSSDEPFTSSGVESGLYHKSQFTSGDVVRSGVSHVQNSKSTSTSSKITIYASTTKAASLLRHCSRYFSICVLDPEKKWKIVTNTEKGFDLKNVKNYTTLRFVYSDVLKLGDVTKKGFTSVSLLGKKTEVYKNTTNGVTQLVMGTQFNKTHVLVVVLGSNADIDDSEIIKISGLIKVK